MKTNHPCQKDQAQLLHIGQAYRPALRGEGCGFGNSFSYPSVLFPLVLSLLTSDAAATNKRKSRIVTATQHLRPSAWASPRWLPVILGSRQYFPLPQLLARGGRALPAIVRPDHRQD